jgi:hypothetical protein
LFFARPCLLYPLEAQLPSRDLLDPAVIAVCLACARAAWTVQGLSR